MNSTSRHEAYYLLPWDGILLRSNEPRMFALADRLWDRGPDRPRPASGAPSPLTFAIEVTPLRAAPARVPLPERWDVRPDGAALSLGERLRLDLACDAGTMTGWTDAEFLAEHPARVARLLLEVPAASLLARRGYGLLHAGTIVGAGGAVVVRGAAGAGKSTLVAAAHAAGLGVLGDETVLAARQDPDDLLATLRDVTLLPDAIRLLHLEHAVTPAGPTQPGKYRLDLGPPAPTARRARRRATVLLGPRDGARAALEPLAPAAFLREFAHGAIEQERWSGTPPHIAEHWSRHGAYRLTGTADLAGAVELLAELVSRPAAASIA